MPLRLLSALALTATLAVAAEGITPAPGHDDLPVLFWAHYMPQVGTLQLDANEHAHGGTDTYPFIPVKNGADGYELHIRHALEAGIDGFQMLTYADPAAYEAARRVRAATGRMFYLNPQWCSQGTDPQKAFEQMARFAVEHRDDPHVFRIGGKQVHFFYGVTWARSDDDERIDQARAYIRERGVEVLFLPGDGSFKVRPTDTLLLDRTDLDHRPWPAFARPEPGPLGYLATTRWDGCDTWALRDAPDHLMAMLVERLRPFAGRYRFIPGVAPGYDSSNRAWQAIHVPHRGIAALRDGLRQAVRFGFRQVDCVTWNDVNETMLLPSTRSPWGFSSVLRFWRGMAEDGRSPYDAPRVVVAYDSEVLAGDELPVQLLVMPERGAPSSDYQLRVRFEDETGAEAASVSVRGTVPDERTDLLAEARLDTAHLPAGTEILSPVVEVLRYDPGTSRRVPVHQGLRLPPVTVRWNKLHCYTAYAVSLDRVDPRLEVRLAVEGDPRRRVSAPVGALLPLRIDHTGPAPLRRVALAEGRLNRGAVREDDTRAAVGEGRVRGFLRVRATRNLPVSVRIADGLLHERHANHWRTERVVQPLDPVAGAAWNGLVYPHLKDGAAPPNGMQDAIGAAVLRCTAAPGGVVTVASGERVLISRTIAELAADPVTVAADGEGNALRLELSLDAVEANVDRPRAAGGEGLRFLPLARGEEATRYLHAWALSAEDRIAWSRPLVAVRADEGGEAPVPMPIIRTRGTFEDAVSGSTSSARNPYRADEVMTVAVPARLVPWTRIDADEGAGAMVNDPGTAHQPGRGWLTGPAAWIADGWQGGALRFTAGGRLALRAKTLPHGACTFSARLRAGRPPEPMALAWDGDRWQGTVLDALRVVLLPDGRIAAHRRIGESACEAVSDRPIHDGWNHVAVVYDLARLRILLDGAPAGAGAPGTPGYQRTHSTPSVGLRAAGSDAQPAFAADLDRIEIIGTALDDRAVEALHRDGAWRRR